MSRTGVSRPPPGPFTLSFVQVGVPLITFSQRKRPRVEGFGPTPPPPLMPPTPELVATKIMLSSLGLTKILLIERLLASMPFALLVAVLDRPKSGGVVSAFLIMCK